MSLTGKPHWLRLDLDVETAFRLMKSDARGLWEMCFDDEERFVDFYFDWVYDPEEIYMDYNGEGRPRAHIHAIVYNLKAGEGDPLPISYISGACTIPQERGQGVMNALMKHMLAEERRSGRVASVLIPADEGLRSYYARHFGYRTISYRYEMHDPGGYIEACPEVLEEEMELSPGIISPPEAWYLMHGEKELGVLLEEYSLSSHPLGGYRLIVGEGGGQALALYRLDDKTCHIDALWADRRGAELFVREMQEAIGEGQMILRSPFGVGGWEVRKPLAMIRPLQLLPFLERYAALHPEADETIHVQDDLLPDNSGSYELKGGSVSHDPKGKEGEKLDVSAFVERFVPEIDINLVHD